MKKGIIERLEELESLMEVEKEAEKISFSIEKLYDDFKENSNQQASVLYVDDEVHNLHTFKINFRRDFLVYIASNVAEAEKILKEKKIHIVIADYRMPDTDGLDFLVEVVQKNYPDKIKIMMTAYADIECIKRAVNEASIYRYIEKPFEYYSVFNIINSAYDEYQKKNLYVMSMKKIEEIKIQIDSISKKIRKNV